MSIFALALIVGFLLYRNLGGERSAGGGPLTPVASVGKFQIPVQWIEDQFSKTKSSSSENPDPLITAREYGETVRRAVQSAVVLYISDKAGIHLDDDQLLEEAGKIFDASFQQSLDQMKTQLMIQGTLKPGASETEFASVFQREVGKSISEYKDEQKETFMKTLEDSVTKFELLVQASAMKLNEKYTADAKISEDDLKKSFDKWHVKRVFISAFEKDSTNPDFDGASAEAKKAQAELKGGLSFDAAIDKYSDDKPAVGKKKPSENEPLDYSRKDLNFDRNFKPILNMKPGDVSDIIATSSGPAIYKVIRMESKLPADYEKQKDTQRQIIQYGTAANRLADEVSDAIKKDEIKWVSTGFKALFDWRNAIMDPDLVVATEKKREALKRAYSAARGAMKEGDPLGQRAAALAEYGSYEDLKLSADNALMSQLKKDRTIVLKDVLQFSENISLRMELAKLSLEEKDVMGAVESLSLAGQQLFIYDDATLDRYQEILALKTKLEKAGASKESQKGLEDTLKAFRDQAFEAFKGQIETNQDYSETGQKLYNDTYHSLDRSRALGFITDAQYNELDALQAKWKVEKVKFDKEAEAIRKKDAEDARKEAERLKKEQQAQVKPPPTGGATPPKSSGSTGGASVPSGGSANSKVPPNPKPLGSSGKGGK